MKCIIIEDQPPAQRILKKYIEDLGYLELRGAFSDAIEALAFLQKEPVDLIFLDIHLPKISGMEFLETLPRPTPVILTTAFPDYALESYEHGVVDYLLKPFSFQRFVKAVSRAPSPHPAEPGRPAPVPSQPAPAELFIKSGYEHIKIAVSDILLIQADADYTEILTPDKRHLSADTLRSWLEKLDERQFVQVHKSYIINTTKIVKVAGNQIYLENDQVAPIGRAFKEDFVNRFLK